MSLAQLSRLLPLPEEELKQMLDYATTLSKTEAAEHFNDLLGDSPQAVEFISSFNSRRQDTKPTAPTPTPTSSSTGAPAPAPKTSRGRNKKKQSNLHTPAPRQIDAAPPPGASYSKKDQQEEYYGGKKPSQPAESSGGASSNFKQSLKSATPPPPPQQQQQQQRTAAGYLISDKVKPKSNPVSRSSTPKPTAKPTKVSIAGGTPMAGASTALNDLDAAIRSLELTTNPTMGEDPKARRCNCVATRHPLQTAAPNCQSCGKVICVKEGLGPCTFCGAPLLSSDDVQGMIRELKLERGRERMAADREAHKRAEVSKKPAPFSQNKMSEAEARAREHRDKLLNFQAQNAKRTTVRDEAADFDVSGAMAGSGGNMWSTPEDRARELKRQQKILREMEWNARPEYEKRRQVVSIDVVGGKVVRKMAAVERPTTPEEEDIVVHEDSKENDYVSGRQQGGGAFSHNPLLGGLIKPVWDTKGKGAQLEGRKDRKAQWRRVQDDLEDNEAVILDGGARGHSTTADEPECG
ncbi:putative zinc finger motif, C2HC5-type-domain-containing protein [Colletotrichum navitas]|uniref:Zinc finger motif, C2HC5-type-domain-containing protein n=1 Tax=Colletotrichum navitas TaxID=681940 RepID=A0AAD8PP09_9PEZI|nr:putative zinc finger motif, C2HC5-type-domain-containing protein [Colletotrichum navitas]KAK1573602.1 putative zinc finger motif, C2HC5-type-domain-containing protein [Colletotrichum navitas]